MLTMLWFYYNLTAVLIYLGVVVPQRIRIQGNHLDSIAHGVAFQEVEACTQHGRQGDGTVEFVGG